MRFHNALALFLVINSTVNAFVTQIPSFHATKSTSQCLSQQADVVEPAPTPAPKKKITSADILARARAAVGQEPEPIPELDFDEDLLDDFVTSLRFLEDRVKNGPGSVSKDDLIQFEACTGRILQDMNAHYEKEASKPTEPPVAKAAASVEPVLETSSPLVQEPAQVEAQANTVIGAPVESETSKPTVIDTSNDEAPAYDGKTGLGLAKGTRNTYIIPGMDQMTGEEYRKALQADVIARQEERRRKARGMVGNRAAHSYLDTLGYGGASASLSGKDN